MKQTNSAIKFLTSQYRSIFKRAYFKGLISAVVLTTGLVAAQAQAAVALTAEKLEANLSGDFVANGCTATEDDEYGFLTLNSGDISGFTGSITIKNGHFGLADDTDGSNPIPYQGGNHILNTTLKGTGTLTVDTMREYLAVDGATHQGGLTIVASGDAAKAAGVVDINLSKITLDSGTLNIHAVSDSDTATVVAKEIVVDGKPLNQFVGTSTNDQGRAVVQLGSNGTASTGAIVFGQSTSGDTKGTKFTLTGSEGRININGSTHASGAQLLASDIEITDGAALQAFVKSTARATVAADHILLSGGEFNVTSDNQGDFFLKLVPTTSGSNKITGVFEAQSGKITTNGTLNLKQGILAISDALEFGRTDSKVVDKGGIVVNAEIATVDIADAFNADEKTALQISAEKLASYLKDGSKFGDGTALKGSVMLTSGGMIDFTTAVDLAKFDYDSGTSVKDGKLVVSGDAFINGDNITVSDVLKSGTKAVALSGLDISATNLTLGSSSYTGEDSLGFGAATAKNVTFASKKTEGFTLANELTLTSTREVTSGSTTVIEADSGSIVGDVIVTGAASTPLTINGGNYTGSDDITLKGGNLVVGTDDQKASSSLTLTGDLTLDGGEIK